ncbi:NADAR family protein [Vibrio owensii]|uniref:NADAR family protein n=1 Tax=Vibrio harveyi group TaxID=717610 RepID=UPI003CC6D495
MKVTDKYVFFYTKHDCFSQHSPHSFEYKSLKFKTAEHWMMFHKARIFILGEKAKVEDVISYMDNHRQANPNGPACLFTRILNANTPQQAKMLGREVPNYNDPVWFRNRCKVVFYGNILKFRQNEKIRDTMIEMHGKTFVEAAKNDKIWGVGIDINTIDINNPPSPSDWNGENLLGKVHDRVCEQIVQEFAPQLGLI